MNRPTLKQRRMEAFRRLGAEDPRAAGRAFDQIERRHHRKALAYCNEPQTEGWLELWNTQKRMDLAALRELLPAVQDGAFFVNQDPRGYAIKLDNDTEAGRAAIELAGCVTDWGGYGLLQSEAYQ
jgi:hypothetical protein